MRKTTSIMNLPWLVLILFSIILICHGQDVDGDGDEVAAPPPDYDNCNGIFLSYQFTERIKLFPHVKNVTAQAWSFKSEVMVLNAGLDELKSWKIFIGFQHNEILVGADGAVIVDGEDFPAHVGNGTYLAGYPMADLKTAVDTAGDLSQIQVNIGLTGTQFGLRPATIPMPKTIRLVNDGYKCPAPTKRGKSKIYVCCKKDPKYKTKKKMTKFLPRQNGDLSMTYDILSSFEGNYLAQVTIDNTNPLGRLDHWNLTWEWMNSEFIYEMKGAYTHKKDSAECIYGDAAKYYKDLDFTPVQNCQKKPVISDLPPEKINDEKIGKIPNCCRNGTVLPTIMNVTKSQAIFQLKVFKMPPNMNRTALIPPQKWKINGVLNPTYKCGAPIRVDASEFPDPNGLESTTTAIASWQVVCNITRPKEKQARCCVSFSAYYNESIIPCPTCACGCDDNEKCNPNGRAMLLPSEALLVPFINREKKARSWAEINKFPIPKKLPCPDNCGVSINWHVNSDYKHGWTARITLFNWDDYAFEDWFTAIQLKKSWKGFEKAYSFNGTMLSKLNNTIFLQGLKGLNYLIAEKNGTNPDDPRVPGKQQTVISFKKEDGWGLNIPKGDGFPTKVIFNGEECALPKEFPRSSGIKFGVDFMQVVVVGIVSFVLMGNRVY